MPTELKRIPPIAVSEELYELLRLYAFQKKINSISAAVRELIKESPDLVQLAEQQKVDLSQIEVSSWGGLRKNKEHDGAHNVD